MDYSIIIPAYNAATTLDLCLQALNNQTVEATKFEVIVVDDGSWDQTKQIALKYPVKYYYQKNKGPASARNFGAKKASGTWILFTDADCEPAKNWLKEMVTPLENGASGVQGAYLTRQKGLVPRLAQLEFQDRYNTCSRYQEIDLVATYAAGFAREVFLAQKGFDENFPKANNEDTELSYRLCAAGYKLVFAPKAIVYHQHPETLLKYLQNKFCRGYWRMKVYRQFPEKALKDRYTTGALKFQVTGLFFGVLLGLFALVWPVLIWGTVLITISAILVTLPSVLRLFKSDPKPSLLIPFFYILRSLALGLGVTYWMGKRMFWPRLKSITFNKPKG